MTIDKTRDELFAEYFEDREGSAKVAEHAYRQGWKDRATYTVVPSTTPSPISDQAAGEPLRAAVEAMCAMLEEGEWAEHVASTTGKNDPLAQRLETAITDLHSELDDAMDGPATGSASSFIGVPDNVLAALDRMCAPLDKSWLTGVTAEEDARCMQVIRSYVLSTAPTTGSAPARQMLTQTEIASCILPGRTKPASPAASVLSDDVILSFAPPIMTTLLIDFEIVNFARALLAASMGGDRTSIPPASEA